MSDEHHGFLRRWRSEWAPTAWDLGAPVYINTAPLLGDARLRDWLKDIRPLRGECGEKEVLLYPQGFIEETHELFGSLSRYFPEEDRFPGSVNRYYVIPETLRPDVWSVWARANVFSLSGSSGNNDRPKPRFVDTRVFETAWHRSGAEGSPPKLSESGIGWLVMFDGRLLELHASDAANAKTHKPDILQTTDEFILELPETMASFHFELHTKGIRRYHKQAILGACLIACGILGIRSMPENVSEHVSAVVAIPLVVGMCQFWRGRAGVRQGQLARLVSRGLFLGKRVPSRAKNAEFWLGRDRGLLAPWFVWGLVKRGASALLVLPLGIIVVPAVDVGSTLPIAVLIALFVCAVLETLVFGVVTNPSWKGMH